MILVSDGMTSGDLTGYQQGGTVSNACLNDILGRYSIQKAQGNIIAYIRMLFS